LLADREDTMINRHKPYQVSARHLSALRSHIPCAYGDVFYTELGRSNSLFVKKIYREA
jgi:hypothetical protein